MRVRFSDSEQWSSPVKPPRSQNYVKPHDARTRLHVPNVEVFRRRPPMRAPPLRQRPASENLHKSGHWRAHSTARLHLTISSCEDFLAQARGSLNVEDDLSLAILFESSADGIERVVAMGWLAAFIEKGAMGQGEFFLGLRPKERRVLTGPFLERLMKGCDSFL